MMGRQTGDQSQLFYLFNLAKLIPAGHLLRRINPVVTRVLADLREKLAPFYSDIGRPSIDPELILRMLIVGYSYGIRFERMLCEEVELHLAYRWFCRLDLDDKVPDQSTFSVNRHGLLHERPYRFGALKRIVHNLSPTDYWRLVGAVWTGSENIREHSPIGNGSGRSPKPTSTDA
jgi:transposase